MYYPICLYEVYTSINQTYYIAPQVYYFHISVEFADVRLRKIVYEDVSKFFDDVKLFGSRVIPQIVPNGLYYTCTKF